MALTVAIIVAVITFGFPTESDSFAVQDANQSDDAFIQVTLPLPDIDSTALQSEPVSVKASSLAAISSMAPSVFYENKLQTAKTPAVEAAAELNKFAAEAKAWHTTTVKPGDNLSGIFVRLGLEPEKLYSLLSNCEDAEVLEKVLPGQVFKIRTDDSGGLQELVLEVDKIRGTRIFRDGDVFKATEYKHEIEKREASAFGVVDVSLYQSAIQAGLSNKVIVQLADIFSWDIDFTNDVRPGDAFTVIYEDEYYSGEKIGSGDILAAEYVRNGKAYRAIGFRNLKGRMYYYTPEGRSLKRAFTRNPVDFSRISSHFRTSRWHPVLGVKRPHRGVDYAAATGTPIKASGDGRVIFAGRKGGYGRTIIIDHDRGYTTLYAHLSRFKKNLKKGQTVSQGQIIGYVGQSGLATGPHLHYEFRVNGVHKNPVTVKLPGAEPISRKHLANFKQHSQSLLTRLDRYQQTRLALYQH